VYSNPGIFIKENHCFWVDKLQMVNTALQTIQHDCILFQIDVDELWSSFAIKSAYEYLTAAAAADTRQKQVNCLRVHCHFFIAPGTFTAKFQKNRSLF